MMKSAWRSMLSKGLKRECRGTKGAYKIESKSRMLNVFNKEEKVQGINRTRDERINNLENSNSIIGEDDKVEYKKTGIERWNVRR